MDTPKLNGKPKLWGRGGEEKIGSKKSPRRDSRKSQILTLECGVSWLSSNMTFILKTL